MPLSRVRRIQYIENIIDASRELIYDLEESGANIARQDARLVIADLLAYIGCNDDEIRSAVGDQTWFRIAGHGGIKLTTPQPPIMQ